MLHVLSAPFRVIGRAVRDWWRDWVNMAALNLAWLLCWLTVLLGPPATFVLYGVVHDYVHGRSFELRETPALLRRYALKSWLWLLGNLLVAGGLWLNLQFYTQDTLWASALRALTLLVGALWLAVQFYTLPYLLEQRPPQPAPGNPQRLSHRLGKPAVHARRRRLRPTARLGQRAHRGPPLFRRSPAHRSSGGSRGGRTARALPSAQGRGLKLATQGLGRL